MSTTTATGRKELRHGNPYLVMTREFRAPVEDVWAAVTESDRLARWIGTWSGDPADGRVLFQMRYEGDDVPSEVFVIDECEAPHRLAITTEAAYDEKPVTWYLELDLAETDGVTTLTFAQSVPGPAMAHDVGPGWDYYLDRMVAAESGGDVSAIVFDDYFPALSDHYKGEFGS
jgi:uncharacterized protein YndB with AHSA1/START domain